MGYISQEEYDALCKWSDALRRAALGDEFVNSHTPEECSKAYCDKIANTNVTSLYKRPYPIAKTEDLRQGGE